MPRCSTIILNNMFGNIHIIQHSVVVVNREKVMKTERKILVAFILNLIFSVAEFVGGILTGSVAILSDALHDLGDATSIGVAYLLEKKSHKQADDVFTFGYARYSVVASLLTTAILIVGSVVVVANAIDKIVHPTPANYDGMIVFALFGVVVNTVATLFTRKGHSLNQKAVSLHMLEDVLGWIVVLVGAIVMKFTDFALIDPIMSIGVAVFILINAIKNLTEVLNVFLEKAPSSLTVQQVQDVASKVEGVVDVHHVHVWTLDGQSHCATMHVVTNRNATKVRQHIRHELEDLGVVHVSVEVERVDEPCNYKQCSKSNGCCVHHHGHHHH